MSPLVLAVSGAKRGGSWVEESAVSCGVSEAGALKKSLEESLSEKWVAL